MGIFDRIFPRAKQAAKTKDVSTYELYVLKSFAGYLWQWILDAGKEFE